MHECKYVKMQAHYYTISFSFFYRGERGSNSFSMECVSIFQRKPKSGRADDGPTLNALWVVL